MVLYTGVNVVVLMVVVDPTCVPFMYSLPELLFTDMATWVHVLADKVPATIPVSAPPVAALL